MTTTFALFVRFLLMHWWQWSLHDLSESTSSIYSNEFRWLSSVLVRSRRTMDKMILRNLFVLISAAIFLGTIILNLLAIVYISSKRDRTSIAILVVNLAVADIIHASRFKVSIVVKGRKSINILLSVGIIFFSSNLFTPNWVFGEFGCKFSLTIDVLCTVVSKNRKSREESWWIARGVEILLRRPARLVDFRFATIFLNKTSRQWFNHWMFLRQFDGRRWTISSC